MYYTQKKVEVSVTHLVGREIHGHNLTIIAYCRKRKLNADGMVTDLGNVGDIIRQLDHKHLNNFLDDPPTGENIARWVVLQIPECYKCSVQMSDGSMAVYVDDDNNK